MSTSLLLEFDTPEDLAHALRELHARGYQQLDAYTPYSTHVVQEALALRPSRLPRWVFGGAIFGASAAYLLQWYTTAYLYPLNVGARPSHMPLAYVPITFEMGVLCAAFVTFFGVLGLGKLIKLWDPIFAVEGFESVSVDRFWLRVEGWEPADDPAPLLAELEAFHPRRQLLLEGSGQ
jgi:ActD protein